MALDKGLVCAYLLDGKGGGKPIGWQEIMQWKPENGLIWIHLDYSIANTKSWLQKESGLDQLTIDTLTTPFTRPRVVENSHGLKIFLRGVNSNPGSNPADMVSIRLWINHHRIITLRKRPVLSVQDICKSIEKKCGPKTPNEFVVMLTYRLVDRMADVITKLEDQIDKIEEMSLKTLSSKLRSLIADLRRQAISLHRYLGPQREALTQMQSEGSKWLNKEDRRHIHESQDRIIQYIENLDSARERAAVAHEELVSSLSDQLNKRMYVLSIVAIIFLPLTFITGLLGVNLAGIPGSHFQWAFTILTLVLILLALFILLIFRYKKWV